MSKIGDLLFSIIPVSVLINGLFSIGKKLADAAINGEELSYDQQRLVRTSYFLSKEWGEDLVKSTETIIDDQALETAQQIMEDAADEGGFNLPNEG